MPLAGLARRAQTAVKAVSAMGLRRTALRVRHELIERSGWLTRRYPAGDLSQWKQPADVLQRLHSSCAHDLFVRASRDEVRADYRRLFPQIGPALLAEADRFVVGEMQYFSHQWAKFDPRSDWFRNPFTGQVVDGQAHWTHVAWDAPASGDLKFQLEPARFAWVFKLARAYQYSGDEKYADAFWDLFDGWCLQNPPQAGPLWICGQESALRLISMVYGLYAFSQSPATTDERFGRLVAMIAAHADRVLGTTVYARSQQNNHALSEGAGLLTAGLLLKESPAAARWERHGRAILEEQVPLQIYDDGGYIQQSHNYHRVMLNVLTWSIRLSEQFGKPLSKRVYERLGLAANFLRQMLDPATGQVPNYGPNDGALILPLSVCPYEDYRPAVQSASWAANRSLPLGPGDWNEDLFWLAGTEVAAHAQQSQVDVETHADAFSVPPSSRFPTSGYDVLRGRESWGMTRAAHYHDRPNQADQLHLDIWWRGINLACDAGAYLYNGSPPWQNAMAFTAVHNTVSVDDQDQMTRVGRFLWLDWAQATSQVKRSPRQRIELWSARHDGYRRIEPGLDHVRHVLRIGDEHWLVLDSLDGHKSHRYRLHWLLAEFPHQWDAVTGTLRLETPAGPYVVRTGSLSGQPQTSLVVGDKNSTRGWRSRYYGEREPAISLTLETTGPQARFWTLLGPAGVDISVGASNITLTAPSWRTEIDLAGSNEQVVRQACWKSAEGEDSVQFV